MRLIIWLFLISTLPCAAQNYQKLHRKAIFVDTHNDVLYGAIMKGLHIEDDLRGKAHSDFKRFKEGGVDVQIFSVWCDGSYGKNTAFKFANIEIDSLYSIGGRNPDKITMVRTPEQLMKAVKAKKLAGMIGVEGGHMIEDNLLYLDSLYKRGVVYMTLTWNNSTSWASSSFDESRDSVKNAKKGLNEAGIRILKRMNELGMMVDVSHIGEQTFWDVIGVSSKPVLASHSSVYSLTPHHRNLKDAQIKAIAKSGGVIQINFAPQFLEDSALMNQRKMFEALHKQEIDSLVQINKGVEIDAYLKLNYGKEIETLRPPISALLDHVDYIVKLVGVNYVGIGSDFDGISSTPKELDDVSDFPNVTKGLLARGYSKKDIRKILGGNFLRVFRANVK